MINSNTYKRISKMLVVLILALLIFSAWCAFTNTWLAKDINTWQMGILKKPQFMPALTMFLMFIPPALVLLVVKVFIIKKMKESLY